MRTKLISAANFSAERNAGKSKCHSEIPSRSSNPSRLRIPERVSRANREKSSDKEKFVCIVQIQ
jgi:hypothetical protein